MKEPIKVARVTLEGTTYSDGTYQLLFGQYEHDGSLAVMLETLDGQPQATVSVCLDAPPEEGEFWAKHWSENEGIPEALEKVNVIEPTGDSLPTGMVVAHGYRLTEMYRRVAAEYLKEE